MPPIEVQSNCELDFEAAMVTKADIRADALARRQLEPDKNTKSDLIIRNLFAYPPYVHANVVLFYVSVRSEVRTVPGITRALESGKRVAVPYCVAEGLYLFFLQSLEELEEGTFGIPEPRAELRRAPDRICHPEHVDLAIIPGVAFDRSGNRVGYGVGYFDRLLRKIRRGTPTVGLAYECQLYDGVPREEHDMSVNTIITEKNVYEMPS